MVYVLLGGVGLLAGAIFLYPGGWFYGLCIGLLTAEIYKLRKRLAQVEERMKAATPQAKDATAGASFRFETPPPARQATPPPLVRPARETGEPDGTRHPPPPDRPAPTRAPVPPPMPAPSAAGPAPAVEPLAARESEPAEPGEPGREAFTDLPGRIAAYVKAFFTTGNVVTKIGVIVLFFGIAFLLKYAAQRNLIPIEFRLILVFLGGWAFWVWAGVFGSKKGSTA